MRFLLAALLALTACDSAEELTRKSAGCVRDHEDPYDPARQFIAGKFAGQCLDATSVRPAVVARETDTHFEVLNFYHDQTFWRARIPKTRVTKAYFQIVPFDSGVPLIKAAHTQFRFLLSEDIVLTAQNSARSARVPDLIISSTFTAPPGVEYEALKSVGLGYGLVTRALSSHARGLEEIVKDKSIVRQFNMKLDADDRNRLLALALRRASTDFYSPQYGLLNSNCTTLVFDVLDDLRPRPRGVPAMRGSIWRIHDEFEAPSIEALRARGLIDQDSEVRPMNDERDWSAP